MGKIAPSTASPVPWWLHGYKWMVPTTSMAWEGYVPWMWRQMQIAGWHNNFRAPWRHDVVRYQGLKDVTWRYQQLPFCLDRFFFEWLRVVSYCFILFPSGARLLSNLLWSFHFSCTGHCSLWPIQWRRPTGQEWSHHMIHRVELHSYDLCLVAHVHDVHGWSHILWILFSNHFLPNRQQLPNVAQYSHSHMFDIEYM